MKVKSQQTYNRQPRKKKPRDSDTHNPETRRSKSYKAFCFCGKKMLETTPQNVWDGIQPRCDKCPPIKE